MKFNRLRGLTTYCLGPIDRIEGHGRAWREDMTKFLTPKGVRVIDPLNKPTNIGLEDDDSRELRNTLKAKGDYKKLAEIMSIIRKVDLEFVEMADFLVCHFDMNAQMCGTMEELFLANQLGKPIVLMSPGGLGYLPDWMFSVLPLDMIFPCWDSVKAYLNYVDEYPIVNTYHRWKFK